MVTPVLLSYLDPAQQHVTSESAATALQTVQVPNIPQSEQYYLFEYTHLYNVIWFIYFIMLFF